MAKLRCIGRGERFELALGDTVRVSTSSASSAHVHAELEALCPLLLPWRTGPFDLVGYEVDAEWRSSEKWRRIEPLIPRGTSLKIADVGCSTGYFMLRALEREPEVVVGFDPVDRCWLQYCTVQALLRNERLTFVPAGLDALTSFKGFFDVVLCMGVIYHQRDPFSAVKPLADSLRPGGTLILESLCIPSDDPYLLVPRDRYAKMRNAWMIPSPVALKNIVERAGLENAQLHQFGPLSVQEQRRTRLAPYESLADFLDPADPSKTVEGYPAPHTAAVVARAIKK
jgi:tRNA (mo5U34)-methyltransferase